MAEWKGRGGAHSAEACVCAAWRGEGGVEGFGGRGGVEEAAWWWWMRAATGGGLERRGGAGRRVLLVLSAGLHLYPANYTASPCTSFVSAARGSLGNRRTGAVTMPTGCISDHPLTPASLAGTFLTLIGQVAWNAACDWSDDWKRARGLVRW